MKYAGPYENDRLNIQEIIFYCASRVRASLIDISQEKNGSKGIWKLEIFREELVYALNNHAFITSSQNFQEFALHNVGLAAAIGQSVEIPIILRSVACDLYQLGPIAGSTYVINRDLLASLDAGCNIDEDLSAVADSYFIPWWTSDNPPPNHGRLNSGTIHRALEHHRKVTGIKEILPVKTDKSRYTWNRSVAFVPEGVKLDCNRCRLYRGVALGVLDNIQDLRHHVHGLEVSYEERADLAVRRAAGFFQLYEAALMKESSKDADTLTNQKGKKKETTRNRMKQVEDSAAAEVIRLSNLPSLKWTWGSDLTRDDVLNLPSNNPLVGQRIPHSGYNISLPWGRYGQDSDEPQSPSPSSCRYSEIEEPDQGVPDILNPDDIPTHYSLFPLRHTYEDPFITPNAEHPVVQERQNSAFASWLLRPNHDFIPSPPQLLGRYERAESSLESGDDADSIISDSGDADDEPDLAAEAADALMDSDTSEGHLCGRILAEILGGQLRHENNNPSISEDELATAAADALMESDSSEGELGGRILAGILGGQLRHENNYPVNSSNSEEELATAAAEALMDSADSDSEGTFGGMLLAKLLGDQFQREENPNQLAYNTGVSAGIAADELLDSDLDFPVPSNDLENDENNSGIGHSSHILSDTLSNSKLDFEVPFNDLDDAQDLDSDSASAALQALQDSDANQSNYGSPVAKILGLLETDSECSADEAADALKDSNDDNDENSSDRDIHGITGPFNAEFFRDRVRSEWLEVEDDDDDRDNEEN